MTRTQRISLYGIALLFVASGLNHLLNTALYLEMMPPYLPAHVELIIVSGILEIMAGVGVLIPRIRRAAGIFMILIMLGVFPANVHMALHPESFPDIPVWILYLRLPLQGVLIWWAWVVTRARD